MVATRKGAIFQFAINHLAMRMPLVRRNFIEVAK